MLRQINKMAAFTLVEVMIAMAIFAIAGTAIFKVANSTLIGTSRLETTTIAQWVASNQLVEVTLDQSWPPKKNQKGELEMADRQWHWLQIVEETEDKRMRAVTIEVREDPADAYPVASLMTYVSQPAGGAE
ncbi:type II secretion system minor pseudopilin GspI [Thalassotalea mangrovi]|uniref:Type II secretion system protein I n=1 Tax=Thalassotalea mangrovi TaxID=2572245 RepID=A0A4U1B7T2_9GAMM|nr:type II secretion system minor pseudopilin GspI [Thalassotalea mangrovi]TKB46680.1 type II secretion system protein GspI [Thalassotalea mangrovi]